MKQIICLLLCVAFYTSCKRDDFTTTPLASLKIINTVAGGTEVKLRGEPITIINNNSNRNFALLTGNQDLYIYPVADSLHPYYHGNNKIVMEAQQMYSLFLGGTPDAVNSLLIHEKELMEQDSNIRIRILNYSPGGPPINVSLSTSSDINEFSNIAVGQITNFKPFSKAGTNTEYTLEFKNAITNELIATWTIYNYLVTGYNHFTLVLQGIVGGTPAAGVAFVLHN